MSNLSSDKESLFVRSLPDDFTLVESASEERLLREYGAVFLARGGVVAPDRVVFSNEAEVSDFQSGLDIKRFELGGLSLELQRVAVNALLAAVEHAADEGLSITPRGGDSARRDYTGTVDLWNSRVDPALAHWLSEGKITAEQAERIRSRTPYEQVPLVFELESEGIFFAKDMLKSIIYSVAPPGTSQHLSCLAFDVREFDDERVRSILAEHFWYQTVTSDLPHFTFLGVREVELSDLGLKPVIFSARKFWIPDIDS